MSRKDTTKSISPSLVVLGLSLRTNDNPALQKAISCAQGVIAIFVLDETEGRALGGASLWWLHYSLTALKKDLAALNIPLILKRGNQLAAVQALAHETKADSIFWNRQYDKQGIAFGVALKQWARDNGLIAESFNGSLLHEPHQLKTKTGGYFKVFTPFWKSYLAHHEPEPALILQPAQMTFATIPETDTLEDWQLLPQNPDWAKNFSKKWQPGEAGAEHTLTKFLEDGIKNYALGRDIPSQKNTSRLSAHLRFGEISPKQIWHATKAAALEAGAKNTDKFLAEIGWREFSHHLLYHNQNLQTENFNSKFDHFTWYQKDNHDTLLRAWQRGQTGYPIVDAGMRQLWETGWMHNRVRMIVGSFLVKHLLIDWRHGEEWFWDTLLDACPANNTAGWQWIAGCGADAAPYFRIFNPILQGEKFDKNGDYVRRFVPELSKLPDKIIHKPWTARPEELALCEVTLGDTYPKPIIDHAFARERALSVFSTMKQEAPEPRA